ncbi:MAG TPA: hypothetical protein VNA89_15905, partial [Gemmatimonadaceae bacterium]|nr:hypothetical protein [Gemmatimonadaceae bacterium]
MITVRRDELDPIVRDVGRLAGLLDGADGTLTVDESWFRDPYAQLRNALSDPEQSQALLDLLASLLGTERAEVLGLPGPNANETWYAIKDGAGNPTGLYIVARKAGAVLHFGVGVRWSTTADPIAVRIWAHVPLIAANVPSVGTQFTTGKAGSPVQLAIEVTQTSGSSFGTPELSFEGVKIAGRLEFEGAPPQVSFVFLKLKLPDGQPAADRSLADLASVAPRAWIEMALALFTAQLGARTPGSPAALVRDHLLPVLGITGAPGIRWEQMPQREAAVLRDWILALLDDGDAMRAWLEHWKGLLAAGNAPIAVAGSGTRADPWRVGVTLGTAPVSLVFTMAAQTAQSGVRSLFPGLMVSSAAVQIAGTVRLTLEAALELARIDLGTTATVEPLTALDVRARLFDTTGTLAARDFSSPAGNPLAPLGPLSLAEIRGGIALDPVQRRPVPQLQLVGVSCGRGSWPVLDLSSANAALDGFASVANSLIQDQIQKVLGAATTQDHPGRHVAALLGIVPSTVPGAPNPWPVDTVLA